MSFGHPTDMQLSVIRSVVRGQHVHDLGAGDCVLSEMLLLCGAAKVTAVDHRLPCKPTNFVELEVVQTWFETYAQHLGSARLDVAFLSWPNNRADRALLWLVRRAKTIIYLGSNTDGNACGGKELLLYFLGRRIEHYVAARPNTLIVLGEPLADLREPTGEEAAGIAQYSGGEIVWFENAIVQMPPGGVLDTSAGI